MPYQKYEVQEFKPFDIVTAFYNDLIGQVKVDVNGKREPGLFLVLSVNDDDTVTACKITSNPNDGVPYCNYDLRLDSHPFLQTVSYVQCDKILTLARYKCRKAGSMHEFCRRGFVAKFTRVLGHLRVGLEENIPVYISPNYKK